MMRSQIHHQFCLAIVLLCLGPNQALAFLQDEEIDKDETRLEFIADSCALSMRESIKSGLDLKIDFLQRFLELEDSKLKKLRVYAKGLAAQHARRFRQPVLDASSRLRMEFKGESFSVNGQIFTFADETESAPSFMITMSPRQGFSHASFTVRTGNRSSGTTIRADKGLEFESSKNFQKSLNAIDDTELERFHFAIQQRKTKHVVEGVMVLLDGHLKLSDQQKPKMKAWVEEHLGAISDQTVHEQVRAKLSKTQLFRETPDFLIDVQDAAWQYLKNSPFPLGW